MRLQRRVRFVVGRARREERGITLAVIALALIVLLGAGAIAIDLSAVERQGQTLQNSADAAALAGVSVWAQTQDAGLAEEVVSDVLAQNGIDLTGADLGLSVIFPSHDRLEVVVTDTQPPVLLASVVGAVDQIERAAVARFIQCDDGCFRAVDVPAPFTATLGAGSGDGFVPITVDHRTYAVNHHGSTIECIDRRTGALCWPAQQLFDTPVTTMNVPHASLVGDRIYYLGWEGAVDGDHPGGDGWLHLGCWNTTTESRCTGDVELFNAGFSTLYATAAGIYVFTGDLQVHCFEPVTLVECGGYGGGLDTAPATASSGFGAWHENTHWNGDRVAHLDQIFVTVQHAGVVWLHCWNTTDAAPCASFAPRPVNGTSGKFFDSQSAGRLFLFRDADGVAQSVCSYGDAVAVQCFDFTTGLPDSGADTAMAATLDDLSLTVSAVAGISTYHAPTNRQFFVSSWAASTTYCHDFTTGVSCGALYTDSPFGPTHTYGYEVVGDCLIGLGDSSIFFTLDADLTGPCDLGSTVVNIDPCRCSGSAVWPPIAIGNDGQVEAFEVRLLSPSGAPLLPADGSFLVLGNEPLDLDSYPELDAVVDVHGFLQLEVNVVPLEGEQPWADGEPPSLLIGLVDSDPHLID